MEPQKQNDGVRYKLANAMKECMRTAPVEKITVKEIVETCGLTRQTFYRNFQDKYDLINWYFDKILLESFEHMGEGRTVYESLVNKFEYIQMEQLFFRAAFKNDQQNCLRDHDFELIQEFYTKQIESRTGRKISTELQFELEMYCLGSVYMTVQWVLGYRKCTPEELAHALTESMPVRLREVFQKLGLIGRNCKKCIRLVYRLKRQNRYLPELASLSSVTSFTVHFILNCKKLHQFAEKSFQIFHTGIFWISRCAGIGMCGFCKEL